MAVNLLVNASATGAWIGVAGGSYVCIADGTFGGTSAQLQLLSPDGVSALDIPDAVLTAEGMFVVDLPGTVVRMALTGGSPSAMYASLTAFA